MRWQRVLAVAACGAGLVLAASPAITGGRAAAGVAGGAALGGGWGNAEEVPGLAALNAGDAEVQSVSCPSAAECVAVGFYTDELHATQGFVVAQHDGQWGGAIEVPGLGPLNGVVSSGVNSVSCPSAGNCVAVGLFSDDSARDEGFVVAERGGVWGKARQIPGLAALNVGGSASVMSVSCPSVGNCGLGGSYLDGSRHRQAFVASEQGGAWRK